MDHGFKSRRHGFIDKAHRCTRKASILNTDFGKFVLAFFWFKITLSCRISFLTQTTAPLTSHSKHGAKDSDEEGRHEEGSDEERHVGGDEESDEEGGDEKRHEEGSDEESEGGDDSEGLRGEDGWWEEGSILKQ